MTIRAANIDDAENIVQCNLNSKTEEEINGYAPPRGFSVFHSVERLKGAWVEPNIVDGEKIYVCHDGRTFKGYILIMEFEDYVEIDNIDVCKEFQGQGVGRELVEFVEKYSCSRNASRIELGTTRNRTGEPWKSYNFWIKLGYRPFDEIKTEDGERYGFSEIRFKKILRC